jgi:hypothetical protein
MRRLRRADFPAAVDEAVSLVRFYVALSFARRPATATILAERKY